MHQLMASCSVPPLRRGDRPGWRDDVISSDKTGPFLDVADFVELVEGYGRHLRPGLRTIRTFRDAIRARRGVGVAWVPARAAGTRRKRLM